MRTVAPSALSRPLAFAAGLMLCLAAGCATEQADAPPAKPKIPMPKQALLAPPSEPACALKSSETPAPGRNAERDAVRVARVETRTASDAPIVPPAPRLAQRDPNGSLSARVKLEYERNCYQRAEVGVRERLVALQAAVRRMIRAIGASKPADAAAR